MDKHFGLVFMLRTYLGIASNIVRPHAREDRKSIGAERCVRTCKYMNLFASPVFQNICPVERQRSNSRKALRNLR
jgi:hypothetical protein